MKIIVPANIRWEIWERDNFTCKNCGVRKFLSIDHIIPESKGGETILDNLQTLCNPCNKRKSRYNFIPINPKYKKYEKIDKNEEIIRGKWGTRSDGNCKWEGCKFYEKRKIYCFGLCKNCYDRLRTNINWPTIKDIYGNKIETSK